MIIIKSLCGVILRGQLKVKKTSVLYYSIDIYIYTLNLDKYYLKTKNKKIPFGLKKKD